MDSIAAVLKDAERRSIKEEAVRLWLKRLTGASYLITDIFDDFEVNTTRKSALRKAKALRRHAATWKNERSEATLVPLVLAG
ncbi:hypothetical protein PR202_gb26948 [Eleusine coracana subsp. coracana]|uniref:Disease resistance N-terminal domain-containing protein n=1 Tax=Eleusine coracana subsp. coracana TaxID=191504 RepID=A0AAV5FTG3_ELECO|nr:hypothetical protein PR202_gb26948 [Eleusine coracana subsp. coracana]